MVRVVLVACAFLLSMGCSGPDEDPPTSPGPDGGDVDPGDVDPVFDPGGPPLPTDPVDDCQGHLDGTPCLVPCFGEATCVEEGCLVNPASGVTCPAPESPCIGELLCVPATGECGAATYLETGAPCEGDGDVCTFEACDGVGQCTSTGDVDDCNVENQNNPCWTYTCIKQTGCALTTYVEGGSCNDNNPCTQSDLCTFDGDGNETCLGEPVPTDDGNPCTDDACAEGEVTHKAIDGIPCDGGGACEQDGLCTGGTCEAQGDCGCASDEDCGVGPGGCVGTYACDLTTGECQVDPASVTPCGVSESPCVAVTCDQGSGQCVEGAANEGADCDDGDLCTLGSTCQTGQCIGGQTMSCDDGNPCTNDVCGGGACFNADLADDTDCGSGKTCQDGMCTDDVATCVAWSYGPGAPADIHYRPGADVLGGRVHLVGGSPSFQHLIFDPAAGSWSEGTKLPGNGVTEGAAIAIGAELFGIHNAFDEMVRIYDGDTWLVGAARPTTYGRAPAVGTDGADLLVFGGSDGSLNASPKVHRYRPATSSWSEETSMPTARGHGAFATVGGKVYVIGGRDSSSAGDILAATEAFDLAAGTWSTLTPMPTPRNSAMAAAVGTKIYVAGGFTGQKTTTVVEVYDTLTDTWSPCDPLDEARSGGVAVEVSGQIYLFGGGTGADKATVEVGSPL